MCYSVDFGVLMVHIRKNLIKRGGEKERKECEKGGGRRGIFCTYSNNLNHFVIVNTNRDLIEKFYAM